MSGETDPYQPPAVLPEEDSAESTVEIAGAAAESRPPGVGRGVFAPMLAGVYLFQFLLVRSMGSTALTNWASNIPLALAAVPRVRNIGRPPAMALLMLIPIFTLYFQARCLILPPDHRRHRKLDRIGKIILAMIIVYVILRVGVAFFNAPDGPRSKPHEGKARAPFESAPPFDWNHTPPCLERLTNLVPARYGTTLWFGSNMRITPG